MGLPSLFAIRVTATMPSSRHVRQLRRSQHNVADRKDSGLLGFQPLTDLDEAAVGWILSFPGPNFGARLAANGDQIFLGLVSAACRPP